MSDETRVVPAESHLQMIERMASSPTTNVDSLERLIALYERAAARREEIAFNAAMSTAQKQMRPIAADATNPQTRSRYASYEALDRALRPIYTEHGFGLSFDTADSPLPEHVRVLCYVTHAVGHARTYKADMPADGKGAKGGDVMTKTHAVGAAMSYGMRYLLKMIFNVAVGEDDTDGNERGDTPDAAAPTGFEKWYDDLTAVADNGTAALEAMWGAKDARFIAYKNHLVKTNRRGWEAIKVRAAKVKAS